MSAAAPINFVEWAIKGAGVWDMGGYNGTWLVFFLRSWRVKRQSKKADTHKPKPNRKKKIKLLPWHFDSSFTQRHGKWQKIGMWNDCSSCPFGSASWPLPQ